MVASLRKSSNGPEGAVFWHPKGCWKHSRNDCCVSYSVSGYQLEWRLPVDLIGQAAACDVEEYRDTVPPALARNTGITNPDRFFATWTMAEVIAKLTDTPIPVLLRHIEFRMPPLNQVYQRSFRGVAFQLYTRNYANLEAVASFGWLQPLPTSTKVQRRVQPGTAKFPSG